MTIMPVLFSNGLVRTLVSQIGLLVGAESRRKRTNLALQSEALNAAPWGGATAVTTDATTAPNGAQTAEVITVPAGGTINATYQSVAVKPNTTYTFSEFVRLITLPPAQFKQAIWNETNSAFIVVDLMPAVVPTDSEWRRIYFSFTTPATCNAIRIYYIRTTAAQVGATCAIWGTQLEEGPVATPYIPTTNAAVTV